MESQRVCRPRCHPSTGEQEVQLSYQNWSNLTGRLGPLFQKNYPHASLGPQQRHPPYARESSCLRYVCLHGETWLPSIIFEACRTLFCRSHLSKHSSIFRFVDRNGSLLFSAAYRNFLQKVDIRSPAWVGQARIVLNCSCRGTGPLPSGTALL